MTMHSDHPCIWLTHQIALHESHLVNDLTHFCCFVKYSTEFLSFLGNSLVGRIPSEVWQLTKLSEYTVIDGHEALVQSLWASIRVDLVILMVCLDCLCRHSRSLRQYTHWYDSI
jgi:uncharacterized Tic20 family protein